MIPYAQTLRWPLYGNRWLLALGIVWSLGVGVGVAMLTDYENEPGAAAIAPQQWPADSRIELVPGRSTLVMLAHPHCPCTRASIGELALLMAHAQGKVAAHVLFVTPTGVADDWRHTDLWEQAAAIPGVQVIEDTDGREARRFDAETSGQTLLYDPKGHLVFSGGITAARGHSGDNTGRSAITSLLTTGTADAAHTAVFGCALPGGANVDGGMQECRQ